MAAVQAQLSEDVSSIIGQSTALTNLLSFRDEPQLLRAVHVGDLTCSAGIVFDVQKRPADTFESSHLLPHQHRIHTFISHNWASSRWSKYWGVILHFHLHWALLAPVTGIAVALIWQAATSAQGWRGVLHLTTTPAMLLMTCFLSNCTSLCGRRGPSCFLDVCCISQTDHVQQRRGIEKLGAFMHNSDHLLVCYSPDLYLKRLWTIYELGTFLVVSDVRCISVMPLALPPLTILLCLSAWLCCNVNLFVVFRFYKGTVEEATENLPRKFFMSLSLVFLCLAMSVKAARAYYFKLARMLKEVRTFDIRTAECAYEGDREYVEEAIVQLMRHVEKERPGEVSRETLLDEFNEYVQSEVPKAIRFSTGAIGLPLKYLLISCSVPLITRDLEDAHYFGVYDPWPLLVMRRVASLCLGFLAFSVGCRAWPHLSGAAHAAYGAAIVAASAPIFVVLGGQWENLILIHMVQSERIQTFGYVWVWVRTLSFLALSLYLLRPKSVRKAETSKHLVPEPVVDTFSL